MNYTSEKNNEQKPNSDKIWIQTLSRCFLDIFFFIRYYIRFHNFKTRHNQENKMVLKSPFINRGLKCDRCGAEYQFTALKCKFCGKSLIAKEEKHAKYSNKNRKS